MAIPAAIQTVIDAAKESEKQEMILDDLKAQKQTHQDAIANLNAQITSQTTVVQNARATLKTAANNI